MSSASDVSANVESGAIEALKTTLRGEVLLKATRTTMRFESSGMA